MTGSYRSSWRASRSCLFNSIHGSRRCWCRLLQVQVGGKHCQLVVCTRGQAGAAYANVRTWVLCQLANQLSHCASTAQWLPIWLSVAANSCVVCSCVSCSPRTQAWSPLCELRPCSPLCAALASHVTTRLWQNSQLRGTNSSQCQSTTVHNQTCLTTVS